MPHRNLDDLLDASSPPTAERTPSLERHLHQLVADSEPTRAPRRRRTRAIVVAGTVVGVLGLGSVASATGLLPSWTLLTRSGSSCEVEVRAIAFRPGDGEPSAPSFTPAERRETLAAAQRFLAGFDTDSIDHEEAIRDWTATQRRIAAGQPADERAPLPTGDDLEVTAVTRVVVERLRVALAEQGLDLRAIAITVADEGCTR